MAVMLNFVIDALSLLNLALFFKKKTSIPHKFFTVLKKKGQHFFQRFQLAHGVAAP